MYLIAFEFIIMNISNNYGFMVLTQFWLIRNFMKSVRRSRDFLSHFLRFRLGCESTRPKEEPRVSSFLFCVVAMVHSNI